MAWQPGIMSASLGRAWLHDFDYKMEQASKSGFKGIEVFYEDIEYVARKLAGISDASVAPTPEQLLDAARHCGSVCKRLGLEVIGLQPFLFYDGLKDREQHDRLLEKMKVWLKMVKLLDTTVIQIPANFLPADQLTDDFDVIASDLRELADMGLKEEPVVRFAYENLCWSTHVDTWEKLWDVVKRVDRPNFGVCLDTFNIAGRVWADPTSPDGKTPNADADLKSSLERMVKEVDMAKVFYIQVVDAERLESPLVEGHPFYVEGNPARMNWSRNARLFMYEEDRGAYLPVEEVARVLIKEMGFKGHVSMELFSRTMSDEGQHVPEEHAERGIAAWKKLAQKFSLE